MATVYTGDKVSEEHDNLFEDEFDALFANAVPFLQITELLGEQITDQCLNDLMKGDGRDFQPGRVG